MVNSPQIKVFVKFNCREPFVRCLLYVVLKYGQTCKRRIFHGSLLPSQLFNWSHRTAQAKSSFSINRYNTKQFSFFDKVLYSQHFIELVTFFIYLFFPTSNQSFSSRKKSSSVILVSIIVDPLCIFQYRAVVVSGTTVFNEISGIITRLSSHYSSFVTACQFITHQRD